MVEGWKVNLLRMLLMYGALNTVFLYLYGIFDYERTTTLMKDPGCGRVIESLSGGRLYLWLHQRIFDNGANEDQKQDVFRF